MNSGLVRDKIITLTQTASKIINATVFNLFLFILLYYNGKCIYFLSIDFGKTSLISCHITLVAASPAVITYCLGMLVLVGLKFSLYLLKRRLDKNSTSFKVNPLVVKFTLNKPCFL